MKVNKRLMRFFRFMATANKFIVKLNKRLSKITDTMFWILVLIVTILLLTGTAKFNSISLFEPILEWTDANTK